MTTNCPASLLAKTIFVHNLKAFVVVLLVTVAQLVEHGTHKPGVVGSIPTRDTIDISSHGPPERTDVRYGRVASVAADEL